MPNAWPTACTIGFPPKRDTVTKMNLLTSTGLLLVAVCSTASANDLSDIPNYREYSDLFSSAGQPSKKQLKLLREEGFGRIVYVAFTNSGKAFDDEDQIVKELGMDYIQIPVDWSNPTPSDFYAFAGVMQLGAPQKTLLHCQVNYRASAFSFLYRVIYDEVPVAEAKADMNTVWQPDETWRALIFEILAENDISADCEGCDWSVSEMHH